jgi:multidrug transporter EmrE-like cation transporter
MGGCCCYGLSTVLYLSVLARLDLSLAYPTVSLGYVLVMIMSRALFKEPVSPIRWLAAAVICAGVVLVGLGAA